MIQKVYLFNNFLGFHHDYVLIGLVCYLPGLYLSNAGFVSSKNVQKSTALSLDDDPHDECRFVKSKVCKII